VSDAAPQHLNLWKRALGDVPDTVWERAGLETLVLVDNALTHLPEGIAGLPRLDKLDLRWVPSLAPPPWLDVLEARGCLVYT
jgi:hypothetical protein